MKTFGRWLGLLLVAFLALQLYFVGRIAAMAVVQSQATSCPSSISQAAAVAALTGPQDVVRERCQQFQARRDLVVAARGGDQQRRRAAGRRVARGGQLPHPAAVQEPARGADPDRRRGASPADRDHHRHPERRARDG
mgnify:CR=1 FL=1